MPRGHKSKRHGHAHQKRTQAKGDVQGVEVAQEAVTPTAEALAGDVEASATAAVKAAIPTAATAAARKAAAQAAAKAAAVKPVASAAVTTGGAKVSASPAGKTAAKVKAPAAVKIAAPVAARAAAAVKPVPSAAVTAGAAKVAAAAARKQAVKVAAPAVAKAASAKAAALASGKAAAKAAAIAVVKTAMKEATAVAAAGRKEPEEEKESSFTEGPRGAASCRPPLTPPRRSPSPGALSSGRSVSADKVSNCDREECLSLASLSTCFSDDPDYLIEAMEWCILQKFHLRQPFTRQDLLQSIGLPYKYQVPDIFKKVCDHLEAIFAVEVREVESTHHSYNLFSILSLPNNGRIRPGRGYPKTGFLIKILAVILIQDHCAAEEDIWKFLKRMQVYPGKKHDIFGEPKRLLTQDFVRLKYLEYRQVPGSVPPCHEFLWGPEASAETNKEKIMKFLTRMNKNCPSYFTSLYEDFGKEAVAKLQMVLSAKPIPVIKTRPITSATYYATGFQPFDI